MKNLINFSLIVGIVLLSACSDSDEKTLAEQSSKQIEFSISATLEDLNADADDETRAIVEPVLRLKWFEGDKISVVNLTSGKILGGAIVANNDGYTTQFSGTLSGRLYYGDVLGFIYPAFGNEEEQDFENFAIDLTQQDGTEKEQGKFVLIGKNQYTYSGLTNNISISFQYLVNFQRVMLSNLPNSTKINEVSLSGVGTNVKLSINTNKLSGFDVNSPDIGTIVVSPSNMSTNETGGKSIYIKVPASSTNTDRKMKVLTENGDFIASYNSAAINAGFFTIRIVPNFEQIINFPDETFKAYMLENFDENKDGMLTSLEAEKVTYIYCMGNEDNWGTIKSLKGIEFLPNLRHLFCDYNLIEELDVSKNLHLYMLTCENNQIKKIDVSSNRNLTRIDCCYNGLEELNVNSNIVTIDCRYNELTSMEFLKICFNLKHIWSGVNKYSSIDVSNCKNLEQLGCDFMNVKAEGLTSLDVSNNPKLEVLYCSNNRLSNLDLSNNPNLKITYCGANPYTIPIDFSPVKNSLEEIWIECYPFADLGLSECTKLSFLRCPYLNNHNLSTEISFDLSKFPILEIFDCDNSYVSSLDLSHNPNLIALHCSDCNLSMLDFSGNPNLQYIDCRKNNLTSLDLRPTGVWKEQYPFLYGIMVLPSDEWYSGFPVLCSDNPLNEVILQKGWEGKIGGFYEGKTHEYCIGNNLNIVRYENLGDDAGEDETGD